MAAITHVHNQHRTSYFVTYYRDGKKCRLQMVYSLEEAREQKAEYDQKYPPVKTWKHKPESFEAPKAKIVEPKADLTRCCFRTHKIEGERVYIYREDRKYACCETCYRDFELGGIYQKADAPRDLNAVEVILRSEGTCMGGAENVA